jgi:hypothetical protein
MRLNGKKLFLIGFIIVLLIGIPVTVYFLQKQQETKSRAQKSTNLTFAPDSTQTAPIQKNIGDSIPLDIMVNPGSNLVSFVKLEIQYDPDKLATASANAFTQNLVTFPAQLQGPIYSPGKIEVNLGVGSDPTKAVQNLAKAGTITFTALANTADGQPTLVTYGTTTQVLSIGSTDQASENVLSSTSPATIAIGGAAISPTEPIPSVTQTPTPVVSVTPTTAVTNTPTPTLTMTITPTLQPSPTGTSSANQAPICNTLAVDRATTGVAPFSITFTANGSDSDGTISKVNFNFGDGAISGDITTSGGIGTNSVNVTTSHTYNNAGTYTASAVLTDNIGDVSGATSCQQTIIAQGGTSVGTPAASMTPTATLAPTGSVGTVMGIGATVLFLIVSGGLLFFIL